MHIHTFDLKIKIPWLSTTLSMTIWKIPWRNVSNNYCSHLCLFDFMWLLTVSHASPMLWMSNLSSKSKTEGCLSRPLEMHISQASIVHFYFYDVKWSERSKKTETQALFLCMTACTYVLRDWTCGIERIGLVHSKWLTNLHKFHARMQCKRLFISRYLGICTCFYFYWN